MRDKVIESPPTSEPGWFAIPGVQPGTRTLEEQMRGLAPALAEAQGKSVCDLGCAEGLIAIEFARAGGDVWACDHSERMVESAYQLARERLPQQAQRPVFERLELRSLILSQREGGSLPRFDIVLALAIVHKLDRPALAVEYVADIAGSLAVFRLPVGSDGGVVPGKHSGIICRLNETMAEKDFALERTENGPRGELVQYWRRRSR